MSESSPLNVQQSIGNALLNAQSENNIFISQFFRLELRVKWWPLDDITTMQGSYKWKALFSNCGLVASLIYQAQY